MNKHRYLLVGILCLFGICLLSAQNKKKSPSAPEKKKVDSIEPISTCTSGRRCLSACASSAYNKSTRVFFFSGVSVLFCSIESTFFFSGAEGLIGSVRMKHDSMYMFCDSALIFEKINSVEAFGNVRMEQGDTLFIYGDYLYYDGM